MIKRFTSMLAFQGQNPMGIDVYKKYITSKDRFLYHGKVDDTHLDYLKNSYKLQFIKISCRYKHPSTHQISYLNQVDNCLMRWLF